MIYSRNVTYVELIIFAKILINGKIYLYYEGDIMNGFKRQGKGEIHNYKNGMISEVLVMYNDVRIGYKVIEGEIMKEYESTIKVLNLNIETLKGQNSSLTSEIDTIKANNKSLAKEVEGYKNKNTEKMKDIELLNQQYDKLNKKYQEVLIEKEAINSKVVSLENDNDLYIKKIRQLESTNNDLTAKYESALEDLRDEVNDIAANFRHSDEYEEYERSKEIVDDTIADISNDKKFANEDIDFGYEKK